MTVELINQVNEKIPLPTAHLARNVVGSLILLGLMGTIIGLSVALGEMSSSVDQFELEALKDRLSAILSGMNTAFSTSVTGLVLTVVLVLRKFARSPGLRSLGALWMLVAFSLVSNVIVPIGTILAERLLYWPSLGFCLLAAVLLEGVWTLGRRRFFLLLKDQLRQTFRDFLLFPRVRFLDDDRFHHNHQQQ